MGPTDGRPPGIIAPSPSCARVSPDVRAMPYFAPTQIALFDGYPQRIVGWRSGSVTGVEPQSGYAELGDQRIAFQVVGDGPIDLISTMGFIGSIDVEWEEPMVRLFFQQMARYARVIRFDRRGTGASDPIALDALPPWEAFVDEIDAVLDAVGSKEAVLMAGGPAGPLGVYYAATHPDRLRALILFHVGVRYLVADDYPIGWSQEQLVEGQARFGERWGTGEAFDLIFPSRAGDNRLRAWYAKLERSITSPGAMQKYQEAAQKTDARSLLPSVKSPTLVIHKPENDFIPVEWARFIVDRIEDARLVTFPGKDVLPYFENPESVLDAVEEFITGARRGPVTDRRLSTVLFTDLVDSTMTAERVGDRRWREMIDFHDSAASSVVDAHDGELVNTTGDGIVATFDGPGRAIDAASSIHREVGKLDLTMRAGIHSGEIEFRDTDIGGMGVHLAARIMGQALANQTLVSSTVKDLVIGSDIAFEDQGLYTLKGFDERWHLYSVVDPTARART